MRKALLFLFIIVSSFAWGQTEYKESETKFSGKSDFMTRPSDPEPDLTYFIGPYTSFNFSQHFEYGAMGGVSFKDIVLLGPYFQRSVYGNNFYGLYTQFNVNPKHYYFHVGYSLKAGFVNGKYIALEPAMTFQHNFRNDKIKFIHSIGWVNGLPSYSFGVWFGNFGEKWWKFPMSPYKKEKRLIRISTY